MERRSFFFASARSQKWCFFGVVVVVEAFDEEDEDEEDVLAEVASIRLQAPEVAGKKRACWGNCTTNLLAPAAAALCMVAC
jgi:hypothetical protein